MENLTETRGECAQETAGDGHAVEETVLPVTSLGFRTRHLGT
jgi:hypothetical protein